VSERSAPAVTVALPGGRTIPGHLQARRQDAEGRWWYEVTLSVPAAVVQPIEGEDYGQVPTERADREGWVLQTLRHDRPEKRAVVLHRPDCWAAKGPLVPANDDQARVFTREGWATLCDACKPEPPTTRSPNSFG
jgi:hypothetical protein